MIYRISSLTLRGSIGCEQEGTKMIHFDLFKSRKAKTFVASVVVLISGASTVSTASQLLFSQGMKAAENLNSPEKLRERCPVERESDPKLYSSEFKWGYSLLDIREKYKAVYQSPKRLPKRMYWDASQNTLILPVIESWGAKAKVPSVFANSVRRHVEEGLKLKYVDGIFFPDMGHSHFFVPQNKWKEITRFPTNEMNKTYEAFFNEPELKVLYHTAEQLQTLDKDEKPKSDRDTFWRFISRNLIGDNQGLGKMEIHQTKPGTVEYKPNTLGELDGYARWGAGFNISANKDGCYAFWNGTEVNYYDLSLFDLEPENRGDQTNFFR